MKSPEKSFWPWMLLAGVQALAACSRSDDVPKATQVAASVNGQEITVHQVNFGLTGTTASDSQARRDMLDKLIDRQLAQQQALALRLDRQPSVMQAIEAAKSEILAAAYIERLGNAQAEPTPQEIHKYYIDHPHLFAQRRVFEIEEIVMPREDGLAEQLQAQLARVRSASELVDWLNAQRVGFAAQRGVRAAEQIPLDLLPRIATLKLGEMVLAERGGELSVFRVLNARPSPLDEQSVAPRIRQVILNERLGQAVLREIQQLRRQSTIEYRGEFTKSAAPRPQGELRAAGTGAR